MTSRSRALPITFALIGLLSLSGIAGAIVPKQNEGSLGSMAFVSERLQVFTDPESIDDVRSITGAAVTNTWDNFRVEHGDWNAVIDKRTGALEIAEGQGVPFIPGRGNQLRTADISAYLGGKRSVDLATMERITRGFLPSVAGLLGVDPKSLQLNEGRSGRPAEHLWNIDFDVVRDGMVVENARVVFRVNNGNLIQFGSENLPSAGVKTPKAKLDRQGALSSLASFIGGFSAADTFVDGGSLRLVPVRLENAKFAEGYAPGQGRGLTAIWQFSFRRAGDNATWQARVDATNGDVLSLRDINEYAGVTGGAKILGTSTNVPMPFANVSSGGFTNSAGVYSFPGGTVTSTLAGQYVRVLDNCGAISLAANGAGDILFGTSAGTDCTTPGVGGVGNTHSSRTQFYHVNRAKEAARGWIGGAWLSAQLTANVNINNTCNAFWNGSTINFYRSGGGCGNTGEIEAVSLHEYGHGADSNDGNGSSPENGTGETYGDWTAALGTHNSCIGGGFLASNCGGYGDACTSCTGVRDIDWAKHTSGVAHTVSNFTQARCPTSATGYVGPCNREGHCESYVSSEALWDFVNRDLPSPGSGTAWATGERLWYLSRSTATAAFACTPSGTWTSNGCNAGSLWKTMRAVDDDDGNLANGTPNSAALFAAFNRHGIACTSDAGASTSFRGCAQPATPTLTLTPGSNTVSVGISGSTGVYDVYRNERGCNAGFIKVANDTATSPFTDNAVANGFTYFYQVTAQPSGNEACASAPSVCQSVTPASAPCTPPAAPTGLTATAISTSQINLSWTASAGATGYNVYRSTTSGGPYTLVGSSATTSFSNTGLTCNTAYFYVVRATNGATCESGDSTQATATTSTCPIGGNQVLTYSAAPAVAIPDNNTTGVTSTINVPVSQTITSISVTLGLTHTYQGDLEVALIGPDNTTVLLHNRTGAGTDNINTTYNITTRTAQALSAFNGKDTAGAWKLRVRDLAAADTGTFNSWKITFNGYSTLTANTAIPDNNTTGITSTINVAATGTIVSLSVRVDVTHTYQGDLEISLIGPDNTTVLLHNRTGGTTDNVKTVYADLTVPAQALSAFTGKATNGAWKLKVRDLASADTGTLNFWELDLRTN